MVTVHRPNSQNTKVSPARREASPSVSESLTDLRARIDRVRQWVAPLWPLSDFVAVNPWVGMTEHSFLDARHQLRRVRSCESLPSLEHLQRELQERSVSRQTLLAAWEHCRTEVPGFAEQLSREEFLVRATLPDSADADEPRDSDRRVWTFAELADQRFSTDYSALVVQEVSRHCAGHFDEGQATWAAPNQSAPLYDAWRKVAEVDRTLDWSGLAGTTLLVRRLPSDSLVALADMLRELRISPERQADYLAALAFSVNGWASFIRRSGDVVDAEPNDDFVALLAMRMAYDLAVVRNHPGLIDLVDTEHAAEESTPFSAGVLTRYALLNALESHEREDLLAKLVPGASSEESHGETDVPETGRLMAQLVFCIDVRSEVLRRHLEAQSRHLRTFGFAGFFGLALEHQHLGGASSVAQCPVLLQPSFRVTDVVRDGDRDSNSAITQRHWLRKAGNKLAKAFQAGNTSCFTFVESLGLGYIIKLVTDSCSWTRPVREAGASLDSHKRDAVVVPQLPESGPHAISLERRIDLAEAMLRNLGLTRDFARVVVFCGHGSAVTNNPLKAGFDCGACGGHSGEPNARIAADLLEDGAVRAGLAERGIVIPSDTLFVAGLHVTTTDEVRLFPPRRAEHDHGRDLMRLNEHLAAASAATRQERSTRLQGQTERDLLRRCRDWSEVRPEWALAGNQAFIVGPREATSSVNLAGRVFLHSYDESRDPTGNVLELILTAPMVVANWINLQYYASTVDNVAFGSGDKAIHNVVGQIGILQGNGGDLATGLAWQSVHDGERLQHAPRRLSVIVHARRSRIQAVIEKHELVSQLAGNGWLTLVAIDQGRAYRWTAGAGWVLEREPERLNDSVTDSEVQLEAVQAEH